MLPPWQSGGGGSYFSGIKNSALGILAAFFEAELEAEAAMPGLFIFLLLSSLLIRKYSAGSSPLSIVAFDLVEAMKRPQFTLVGKIKAAVKAVDVAIDIFAWFRITGP